MECSKNGSNNVYVIRMSVMAPSRLTAVGTENLSSGIVVMKSAQDGT
jgi:hypothetical protein